jgi:hypothetical protein
MEKYKDQIEYIARLVAFLLPWYSVAKIYNLIKTHNFNCIDIVWLSVSIIAIFAAYSYLAPNTGIYIISMIGVLLVTLIIVINLAKLFRR